MWPCGVCVWVCVFYSDNTLVAAHCLVQSDEPGFQGHLMKIETPNGFVLNCQKMALLILASRKQSATGGEANRGANYMLLWYLKTQ